MADENGTIEESGRTWATEGYTLLFLEICIVILNVLAVVVIFRFERKHNPDILILSLAIADLTKAFIPLNMTLVAYLAGLPMETTSTSCAIFGWTAFTLNSGVMLVMTFMAFDRYVAICWPFEYRDFLTRKRLICTIVAIFVFSGSHSMLPLVGLGQMKAFHHGSFCHFDFDSTVATSMGYSIFVLVLGISMLVVVVFCYSRAMYSVRALIRRQARRMSTSSREINVDVLKQQAMNHMFARLMLVMMVVFCISWLLFLVVVLQHVSGWFSIPPEAHFWSMRLAVANSIFNPVIGAIMCKRYRKGYLFIICKVLHCCGLFSSYQAEDPWQRTRRLSNSSRRSNSNEGSGMRGNEEGGFIGPFLNSNFDSGIASESNEFPGSRVFNHSGFSNHGYQVTSVEPEEDVDGSMTTVTDKRPTLSRKRISFKDELEAMRMDPLSAVEEVQSGPRQEEALVEGNAKQSENDQCSESAHSEAAENKSEEDDTWLYRDPGTNKVVLARSADITKKNSFGGRKRKYGVQGPQHNPFISRDPNTQTSPWIHGQSEREDHNALSDPHTTSSSEKGQGSSVDDGGLSLNQTPCISLHPSVDHIQPTDKETKPSPLEPSSAENKENTNSFPRDAHFGVSSDIHSCGSPRKQSTPSLIHITDFPIDTNNKKTRVLVDIQSESDLTGNTSSSKTLDSCEGPSLNSETLSPYFKDMKSLNVAAGSQQKNYDIPRRHEFRGRRFSDHPSTQKRALSGGPLFDKQSSKTKETLFVDPSLHFGNHHHSWHMEPSNGFDMLSFKMQSDSSGGEFFSRMSNWRLSEPDLTRFYSETKLLKPGKRFRTFDPNTCAAQGQHDSPGFDGSRPTFPEQKHRASNVDRRRSSSQIYRHLSQRNPEELKREIFC